MPLLLPQPSLCPNPCPNLASALTLDLASALGPLGCQGIGRRESGACCSEANRANEAVERVMERLRGLVEGDITVERRIEHLL